MLYDTIIPYSPPATVFLFVHLFVFISYDLLYIPVLQWDIIFVLAAWNTLYTGAVLRSVRIFVSNTLNQ